MKKKILVIDDSALMRRVISDIINSDGRFEVEGVATNGLEGLDLVLKNPKLYDAILLDINMPKMNGLEFLEQLQKYKIKQTIIVVSTVVVEGAKETIRALELGAFDFVTKPESFVEVKRDEFKNMVLNCLVVATKIEQVNFERSISSTADRAQRSELISKTEEKFQPTKKLISNRAEINRPTAKLKFEGVNKQNIKKLVALACSTGGPRALQDVIPFLPADLDASVLIVQHMPVGFTYSLAVRLNEISKIEVKEAEDGEIIRKGVVYIAKGGTQMRLIRATGGNFKIELTDEPARDGLKPCANIMYESLVKSDFDEITCVVLTGMGADGTLGIKQLAEVKNTYVVAQDEATCTVYGMPKVIAEAGLTDLVVPLKKVADAIVKNVGVR